MERNDGIFYLYEGDKIMRRGSYKNVCALLGKIQNRSSINKRQLKIIQERTVRRDVTVNCYRDMNLLNQTFPEYDPTPDPGSLGDGRTVNNLKRLGDDLHGISFHVT
jgi:hypothetical protein